MMRLAELLRGVPVVGAVDPGLEIGGIAYDSRRVQPGDLFVAWAGEHHDGGAFGLAAIERGAVAVIAPGPRPAGVADATPSVAARPWLQSADPRRLLGELAARFYGHPDRELVLAAVTATTVALLEAILNAAGLPAGQLGTIGYRFGGDDFSGGPSAIRTTPEGSDLFAILRAMRERGARAAAMEVSSHALAQGRVDGALFDVAVFTNLTRDHFDFHGDFEGYFDAKRKLFSRLKPGGRAVVNLDDPYGRRLAAELPDALGYGEGGAVAVRNVVLDEEGIRALLVTPRGHLQLRSPLLGRYNLYNVLAAAAAAEALGLAHEAIAAGIAARGPLPGRMEPVRAGQPFPVVVDYAHTDAALEAALRSLREFTGGKVAIVFGCGGDRDPGKRALMGRVAGELAELPIVTTDNPRSEDPMAILAAVEQGVKESGNNTYRVVPDRREAIRRALAVATPGWAVLVAGKGHESEQILADRRVPFSDREEIERALEERYGRA
jgi:UDP-N-acetylmuramoyl-L-alanyl-D-glutamate--2,6-diaminopimelate ligase